MVKFILFYRVVVILQLIIDQLGVHVKIMAVPDQVCPEIQRYPSSEILDAGVNVGGGDRKQEPVYHIPHKVFDVEAH